MRQNEQDEVALDLASIKMSAEVFPADKYAPIGFLGESSRAIVILARDRQRGTKVAVKCFKRIGADLHSTFETETKKNKQLNHSGIARLAESGVHNGRVPYTVTEYKDGFALDQCLAMYGTPSHDVAVKIMIGVCDALLYAGKQGVLHRDIRPGNIIFLDDLNSDPAVSLTDFALPKVKMSEGVNDPVDAIHMSADEARGLEYSERSEIYAVGCIGFALLTGRPPFQGNSVLDLKNQHSLKLHPRVSDLKFDNTRPKDLEELVERCLDKDPGNRLDSLAKLKERLEVFPRREQLQVATVLASRQRKKIAVIAGAGLLVLALCAAGLFLFSPH